MVSQISGQEIGDNLSKRSEASKASKRKKLIRACSFQYDHNGDSVFIGCGKHFCADHGHFPLVGVKNLKSLSAFDAFTLKKTKPEMFKQIGKSPYLKESQELKFRTLAEDFGANTVPEKEFIKTMNYCQNCHPHIKRAFKRYSVKDAQTLKKKMCCMFWLPLILAILAILYEVFFAGS